jgi:hypothetical protein
MNDNLEWEQMSFGSYKFTKYKLTNDQRKAACEKAGLKWSEQTDELIAIIEEYYLNA